MSSMDRSTAAKIAALSRWGRLDKASRKSATQPGRQAFLYKFEAEPSPRAALRAQMLRTRTARKKGTRDAQGATGAKEADVDVTDAQG